MNKKNTILLILALALIIRLVFAFSWHEIWWDSGVYIGMGKYIYSSGTAGLWEHIRPPLLPIMLGLIWKIGLDPVLFGRLLEIILMLGVVWLTYKLTEHWFNKKTAIIASLIIAASPIFYYLSFHQYTEIPSTFLLLLTLYLFVNKKHFFAGISAGLTFLAKFPAGIILAALLLFLLYTKKYKSIITTALGFGIITLPYFSWSWYAYGSFLATITAAQDAIARALGCNVLRYKPWWQYGHWLIFSETKLHFMAIPGVYALWKQWKKKHLLFAVSLVLPAIYFIQLHCRDYRYLTLFLPFVAMLTALGVIWAYNWLAPKKKQIFTILVIVLTAWMLHTSIKFYYGNEAQQPNLEAEEYFQYLADKEIKGEIWTANPIISAYLDAKVEKIYYPIYDKGVSQNFTEYITQNQNKIGAILLDNCGGGIICPPGEPKCPAQTENLITQLNQNFKLVFDKQKGRCWYKIWTIS